MRPSTDIATLVTSIPESRERFPWPDHEYVRGWGIFGLPFDSGHYLALRVFPQNDFAPYVTLWHRTPEGEWSIYADAPRLDVACPRYYGSVCTRTELRDIELQWTGPRSLHVSMPEPAVSLSVEITDNRVARMMNRMGPRMPLWTWRWRGLLAMREMMASRLLGLGRIELRGRAPSGHWGTLMPKRMYFIESAQATFEGEDLGRPTHLDDVATIGDVTLPARGVLAVGQAAWKILDPAEYEHLRSITAPSKVSGVL